MQQFETLNRQQQPFIQSGYGALGKLNTLLGIGARPRPQVLVGGSVVPMPVNGMKRLPYGVTSGPKRSPMPVAGGGGGTRLKQILMLRAMNGDTEAGRMLEIM